MSGDVLIHGIQLNEKREDLTKIHIESYNALFTTDTREGLIDLMVENIPKREIDHESVLNAPAARVWIEKIEIGRPTRGEAALDQRLLPTECRLRRKNYAGELQATIGIQVASGVESSINMNFGNFPIMFGSIKCHTFDKTKKEMVEMNEDERDLGGYFICNGNERAIRMLILTRRNKGIAVKRNAYKARDHKYTEFGIVFRGTRNDQSSVSNIVHYVSDGSVTIELLMLKAQYLLPAVLLLRCLKNCTDREIYQQILMGEEDNSFMTERVESMLRLAKETRIRTQAEALAFIGSRFRDVLYLSKHKTDIECGEYIISQFIFVNCKNNIDKWYLLIHLIKKIYALAEGRIQSESTDSLDTQEALLPGHLLLRILKERLEVFLSTLQYRINRDQDDNPDLIQFDDAQYMKQVLERPSGAKRIGERFEYFMNTGNLKSESGLDLMQVSGFTLVAERINYARFMAQFRAIHRGQFFTEMRTTAVRKLLPGNWGFLCPVHTPDGSPCGLLNHIALQCQVITHHLFTELHKKALQSTLIGLGMIARKNCDFTFPWIPIVLDGVVLGGVSPRQARRFCRELRCLKINRSSHIPQFLEIVENVDPSLRLFPEILLASEAGRFIRPVHHLHTNKIEWISPIEQMFMEIAVRDSDIVSRHTHKELSAESMLSALASCTPLSDFNQSPRNMYQCQMFKQTMGIHCHNYAFRTDNKSYRLANPQKPICRNDTYNLCEFDDYPFGTNSIVAVLAYTGYDMEDAMIICKGAEERGFKQGIVYKSQHVDLYKDLKRGQTYNVRFCNIDPKTGKRKCKDLDDDGLPIPGTKLEKGSALYATLDELKQDIFIAKYRYLEPCTVEDVNLFHDPNQKLQGMKTKMTIKFRYVRNPTIGDKFASRAGQKGTMATLWPQEDMPWTESGMQPDLIINPHAFPSRMTIGMLIESMAGKVGCLTGKQQDTSPFKWSEEDRAIDYWGEKLNKNGYHYYGSEPMYSGVSGKKFKADLYIGVVYYQRLRHMVSDKYQVRSTGPVDSITGQPVKGRKRGGGIKIGEMERDAIISHGVAFVLQDRLMNCSDAMLHRGCAHCGSILSTCNSTNGWYCRACDSSTGILPVTIPQVYLYLQNELASMGFKLKLEFGSKHLK